MRSRITHRRPMDDIIEQVSAKVHEDWMNGKRAKGIESRKSETGEELMVPYAELSDAAQELDRSTVRTVLSALPALGFSITTA
jgi:RyR domain-containing protein